MNDDDTRNKMRSLL